LIFGAVAPVDAVGAILAHSLTIAGKRWPKGRRLTAADAAAALAAGVASLTVARPAAGDIGEDAAASALAAALAGAGVAAQPAAHGRVNLAATSAGLVNAPAAAIDAVNAVDEALTLGALADAARVAPGDLVATIKIIPYAVAADTLARVVAAVRPLSVTPFRAVAVDWIQTKVPGISAKMLARTDTVTRARLAALGIDLAPCVTVPHQTAALAAHLAQPTTAAITLVAGASATADRGDVIPAAIVAAGGRIERLGMPVDPGNLLLLGSIGARMVVGLPGCARSPRRNGFDWVLERLVAGLTVTSADIAAMGSGGLLAETDRPEPRRKPPRGSKVGAIVLAAGRSTRMGSNKLLADLNGKPVVAHIVDSITAAGLPPPLVVLGNMADEVRAALTGRPATFVTAPDYAAGLSASLRAGIAAVPADWSAALVCLGDMPRVTPATLRALAAAATGPGVVAVPMWNDKRGNPVLWGNAHFARLATLSGDVGGKALLAEAGDALVEVAADSDGVLADIDTPEALAAMRTG
jgi:molybdenum cofactor cytidylyltransferase